MSREFERFAGACALLVAVGTILYGITFAIYVKYGDTWAGTTSAALLMLGGVVGLGVVLALFARLERVDRGFARLGLVFGIVSAAGSVVHGGFDLAAAAHPPAFAGDLDAIDPRGLLTFGMAALSIAVAGWLILRGGAATGFPERLGRLAYLSAVLLLVLYVGRLTILNPKNPVLLVAALVEGLVVNPLVYVTIGRSLRSGSIAAATVDA
ncbi:MAG TPA: hypothetical protein VID47_17175 [Actinomycetota bacterium]|jgi:hypothetical protein